MKQTLIVKVDEETKEVVRKRVQEEGIDISQFLREAVNLRLLIKEKPRCPRVPTTAR